MATSLHSCGIVGASRGLGMTRCRGPQLSRSSVTVVAAWELPKLQLPKIGGIGGKKAKESAREKGVAPAKVLEPEPEKRAPPRKSLNITEGSYTVMGTTRKRNEDRFQINVREK